MEVNIIIIKKNNFFYERIIFVRSSLKAFALSLKKSQLKKKCWSVLLQKHRKNIRYTVSSTVTS